MPDALLPPVVDDDGAPFWEYAARANSGCRPAPTAVNCASRRGPAARTAGPSTASGA